MDELEGVQAAIERLRRLQPRNSDVLLVCGFAERLVLADVSREELGAASKARGATLRGSSSGDRKGYMKEYMRDYRARKNMRKVHDAGLAGKEVSSRAETIARLQATISGIEGEGRNPFLDGDGDGDGDGGI